jgi:hypothetical protein
MTGMMQLRILVTRQSLVLFPQEQQVQAALRAQRGFKARKVYKVSKAFKVFRAFREPKVHRVSKVFREPKDLVYLKLPI